MKNDEKKKLTGSVAAIKTKREYMIRKFMQVANPDFVGGVTKYILKKAGYMEIHTTIGVYHFEVEGSGIHEKKWKLERVK